MSTVYSKKKKKKKKKNRPYYIMIHDCNQGLQRKFLGILGEIVFPPLTLMVDPIMNLMNKSYYECERREHHSPCLGIPKNY